MRDPLDLKPYERDRGPGLGDDHWPWWSLPALVAALLVIGALYRLAQAILS